jgi:hypothetical protein
VDPLADAEKKKARSKVLDGDERRRERCIRRQKAKQMDPDACSVSYVVRTDHGETALNFLPIFLLPTMGSFPLVVAGCLLFSTFSVLTPYIYQLLVLDKSVGAWVFRPFLDN